MRKTNKPFPKGIRLGPKARRWPEHELREWEGETEIPADAERRYLTDVEVARRYGISRQTVWRWASRGRY